MKNQMILTFLIGTLFSCECDKEMGIEQCPEKWQLIKMSGNIANVPPSTGSDMTWQEWYLLYPNATFIKTRERDNVVTEQAGTYATITLSDGEYLQLVYESDNDIIGNCNNEAKETLKINSQNEMTGTWWACDGPGLFYEKVEYNCVEL
jgi:hypothetical protein